MQLTEARGAPRGSMDHARASAAYRQLHDPIDEVLLRVWDPIGVADEPAAANEYRSYIGGVFRAMCSASGPDAIAAHLRDIEMRRMGMDGRPSDRRSRAASTLFAFALEHGLAAGPFSCAACGFLVFDRPPGSYEICPVCGWEDDAVQLGNPALRGGANAQSLVEAQRSALNRVPAGQTLVRGYRRDSR